jgi:hypothetical protein
MNLNFPIKGQWYVLPVLTINNACGLYLCVSFGSDCKHGLLPKPAATA